MSLRFCYEFHTERLVKSNFTSDNDCTYCCTTFAFREKNKLPFTLVFTLNVRIVILVERLAGRRAIGSSILKAWSLSNKQFLVSVSSAIPANVTAQVGEVLYFFDDLSIDCDGITGSTDDFHHLGFPVVLWLFETSPRSSAKSTFTEYHSSVSLWGFFVDQSMAIRKWEQQRQQTALTYSCSNGEAGWEFIFADDLSSITLSFVFLMTLTSFALT